MLVISLSRRVISSRLSKRFYQTGEQQRKKTCDANLCPLRRPLYTHMYPHAHGHNICINTNTTYAYTKFILKRNDVQYHTSSGKCKIKEQWRAHTAKRMTKIYNTNHIQY